MCYKTAAFSAALLCLMMFGATGLTDGQTPTPTPKASSKPATGFKRWIEIEAFTLSSRYRFLRSRNGATIAEQEQWQMQFKPRLKFDKAGRYSVAATIATGNAFNGGWNNTGLGTGHGQTNLFVKHLYFDAKPDKNVEIQFGGIAVNNGENSEVIGFDNDNYITGERLTVRAPKHVWFDEISATNAFLGDLNHPSIFGRLHMLDEANYHQFLFRKQVTKQVGFSADYTFLAGTDTIREAIRVKPKNFFLTTVLIEGYQRVSAPRGNGFDIFGERVFNKHWTASGGFAQIDRRLTLNGDRYPPGKRLYASFTYKPTPEFSLSPVIIQAVGPLATATTHRTRFEVIFTWNILETLRRHHIL